MLAQVLLSAARVAGGGLAVAGLVGDFLLLEWMFECLAEVVWLVVAWRWLGGGHVWSGTFHLVSFGENSAIFRPWQNGVMMSA